jgi:hypothetical protein
MYSPWVISRSYLESLHVYDRARYGGIECIEAVNLDITMECVCAITRFQYEEPEGISRWKDVVCVCGDVGDIRWARGVLQL